MLVQSKLDAQKTVEINIKEYYYTADLCLTAILRMNNHQIAHWKSLEQGDQKVKLVFYFRREPGILKLIDEYFNTPFDRHPYKKFYAELREIKNLIYST